MTLDESFAATFATNIADLPGVEAVALGGSRASGTATEASDWDFALYYRQRFDANDVRRLGLDGIVFDVGGWGGGVMNGGAWLRVEEAAGPLIDETKRNQSGCSPVVPVDVAMISMPEASWTR